MNLEKLREALLAKPHATEGTPFGPDALVYKVGGKIFAIIGIEWLPPRMNLKCDPDELIERTERYPDTVLPGYYTDKKHWITVAVDDALPQRELLDWIDESWRLVVAGLTRKKRRELGLDEEAQRE